MKALVAAVVTAVLLGGCTGHGATASPGTGVSRSTETSPRGTSAGSANTGSGAETFDRHRFSLTDPTSIWVIVNKKHPISPLDFHPQISIVRGYQVATPAAAPLARMLDAADQAGVALKIASAYRSYEYQEGVHGALVSSIGQKAADALSARPGYSEHQTGLAVDLQPLDGTCALDACFAHTPAYQWLAAHAWTYGFVIRYTAANRALTGYSPEPWHFRYVGQALAGELRRTGAGSLEQFFGVTGGDYPTS